MEENNVKDLLKELEDAAYLMMELNDKLPEIRRGFDKSEHNIKKIEQDFRKSSEMLEEIRQTSAEAKALFLKVIEESKALDKDVKTKQKVISDSVKEMEAIQKKLERQAADFLQMEKMGQTLQQMIGRMEALEKENKQMRLLSEKLGMLEEGLKFLYRQQDLSIRELIKRYSERPLIIEKRRWTNDYCFVLHGIIENTAYGSYYQNGKLFEDSARIEKIDEPVYRVYEGVFKAQIMEEERAF